VEASERGGQGGGSPPCEVSKGQAALGEFSGQRLEWWVQGEITPCWGIQRGKPRGLFTYI